MPSKKMLVVLGQQIQLHLQDGSEWESCLLAHQGMLWTMHVVLAQTL
jgi:hypothetical protein